MVGQTPVQFFSKRQGAIATSTYSAEFCALRVATEEVTAIRYMLRCLGVVVSRPTFICGDNLGVIQNASLRSSMLRKRHMALAYHAVREATAAGTVLPVKIPGKDNLADLLTKPLTKDPFQRLTNLVFHG